MSYDQRRNSLSAACLLLISLCLLPSCAFIKREGRWGSDAFKLRARTIGRALVQNAQDRHVWVPLVGAAALSLSKQDRKISAWASTETPVFGNRRDAKQESNELRDHMRTLSYASLFLTPSWDGGFGQYAFNKAKGGAVMYGANAATHSVTNSLQKTFKRERPNKKDHSSLPSFHSSRTSTYHLLNRRNVAASQINPYAQKAVLFTSSILTAGTMWARVEAKYHYPSDTLAGYAVGQFVGGVIFDVLMNLDTNEAVAVYPAPGGGLTTMYSVSF